MSKSVKHMQRTSSFSMITASAADVCGRIAGCVRARLRMRVWTCISMFIYDSSFRLHAYTKRSFASCCRAEFLCQLSALLLSCASDALVRFRTSYIHHCNFHLVIHVHTFVDLSFFAGNWSKKVIIEYVSVVILALHLNKLLKLAIN